MDPIPSLLHYEPNPFSPSKKPFTLFFNLLLIHLTIEHQLHSKIVSVLIDYQQLHKYHTTHSLSLVIDVTGTAVQIPSHATHKLKKPSLPTKGLKLDNNETKIITTKHTTLSMSSQDGF